MTYLLIGFPCGSLGAYPFKPEYRLAESYNFACVFGASEIDCPVRVVPWLAAFVGGDVTAGLLHIINRGVRRFILIDLGTNGEIALCDDGKLIVTSTAAGQAMNTDCAVTIGLLLSVLREKTLAVGNSSLAGAVRLLLSPGSAAADLEKPNCAVSEINLAAHPRFNDLFMEHMYFKFC